MTVWTYAVEGAKSHAAKSVLIIQTHLDHVEKLARNPLPLRRGNGGDVHNRERSPSDWRRYGSE